MAEDRAKVPSNHCGCYLDLREVIDPIKRDNAKTVGLQFPAGLKHLFYIAKEIEFKTDARVIISGRSSYGACDIDESLKRSVDILFHFGHAQITEEKRTVFVEVRSNAEIKPVVNEALEMLNSNKIGLITTVQHIHTLNDAEEILSGAGKDVVIGEGDSRIRYPGQVLGCNFSSARTDCDELLFIGSGGFHPVGASIATGKRVVIADPLMNEVREAEPEKIIRQRYAIIGKALDADSFGILIGSKKGQNRFTLAEKLYEKAKRAERDAYMIMLDEFDPDQLISFNVDAFVNTACPRIAVDNVACFKKPMLAPVEFEILLGEREWGDLVFDEIMGE